MLKAAITAHSASTLHSYLPLPPVTAPTVLGKSQDQHSSSPVSAKLSKAPACVSLPLTACLQAASDYESTAEPGGVPTGFNKFLISYCPSPHLSHSGLVTCRLCATFES